MGEVFFPIKKGILCVWKVERNYRSRDNRGWVVRVTNDCRLRSWGGSRLGTCTVLYRAREMYVYVNFDIIVAIMEGVFVSNSQVD